MKNKNKTIVEPKKGSLSKKIGTFAIAVVLYVTIILTMIFVVCTLSLVVNADSTHGQVVYSNPYTYSSMIIDTDEGSYCVGSNDYFSTYGNDNDISFDDYYAVLAESDEPETPSGPPTDLTGYNVFVPSGWSSLSGFLNVSLEFYSNSTYYEDFSIGFSAYQDRLVISANPMVDSVAFSNNSSLNYINYTPLSSFTIEVVGGTDATNQKLIQWLIDNNSTFTFFDNGGSNSLDDEITTYAVADSPISIKRTNYATYNDENRNYSVFSEITSKNIIGFRFNFTKDIAVSYSQLVNNLFYYNYSMTNDYSITKSYKLLYYDTDGNLQLQEITSVISYDSMDVGTLLPTLNEIELNIGEDNIGLHDIFLIQDLYVTTNSAIVADTDYVHMFEWLAYYPLTTEQITNDYVNNFYKTTKIDIGEILLNSVNGFLGFELIPGFSLLSLLALVIGIPLLIYILKLFLGG